MELKQIVYPNLNAFMSIWFTRILSILLIVLMILGMLALIKYLRS